MSRSATSAGTVASQRPSRARGQLALTAIRLAALWVLVVSLIKLFQGSPNDLPVMVQNFLGETIDVSLKFQLVAAIELSAVFLAFLHPRWGWPLLVAMFLVFVGILATMMSQGIDSCGCFGGAIKMSPATMLLIDGACLLAIVLGQPWKHLPPVAPRWKLIVPALAVAWIAPFVVFQNEELPIKPPAPPAVTPVTPDGPAANGTPPPPVGWQPLAKLPDMQQLKVRAFEGKRLTETWLNSYFDVELYPQDATWIFYRITCEHCAKEFREIQNDPERAAKLYVLIRIPEKDEEQYRQVQENDYPPIFQDVLLPPLRSDYIGQTPWMLDVVGGVVEKVTPGEGVQ